MRTTRSRLRSRAATLVLTVLLVTALPGAATANPPDKQPVSDFATGGAITGTFSMLDRSDDAISTKIRTTATPGHAVTLWYVVFNAPENCSGTCGLDDLGSSTAGVAVVHGGGGVVNPGGRLALEAGLTEGGVHTGQILIGDSTPLDVGKAGSAEVHIVLQDHGMAHTDPALLEQQLTLFHGACNSSCEDIQFAIHIA